MFKLSYDELLRIHDIALLMGGVPGVKNPGLLHSAINIPFQTMFGEELYPTNEAKISVMVHSLINNHGFEDANKRTGIMVMQTLLEYCDIELTATDDDYEQLAINIATIYTKEDVIDWINKYKIN